MPHDWFSKPTGFREERYELTRRQLAVEGDELVSTVNGKRYGIGSLSLPTLGELRTRVEDPALEARFRPVRDRGARDLHADPELEGPLFQVASQFNLLEIAAGQPHLSQLLRPRRGGIGQTRSASSMLWPVWVTRCPPGLAARRRTCGQCAMRSGYALCTERASTRSRVCSLMATTTCATNCGCSSAIGLHRDVEVTDVR